MLSNVVELLNQKRLSSKAGRPKDQSPNSKLNRPSTRHDWSRAKLAVERNLCAPEVLEIMESLKYFEVLANCMKSSLMHMAQCMQSKRYGRGDVLFRTDTKIQFMFLIIRGKVQLSRVAQRTLAIDSEQSDDSDDEISDELMAAGGVSQRSAQSLSKRDTATRDSQPATGQTPAPHCSVAADSRALSRADRLRGTSLPLCVIGRCEILGEAGIIGHRTFCETAVCLTRTDVCKIRIIDFIRYAGPDALQRLQRIAQKKQQFHDERFQLICESKTLCQRMTKTRRTPFVTGQSSPTKAVRTTRKYAASALTQRRIPVAKQMLSKSSASQHIPSSSRKHRKRSEPVHADRDEAEGLCKFFRIQFGVEKNENDIRRARMSPPPPPYCRTHRSDRRATDLLMSARTHHESEMARHGQRVQSRMQSPRCSVVSSPRRPKTQTSVRSEPNVPTLDLSQLKRRPQSAQPQSSHLRPEVTPYSIRPASAQSSGPRGSRRTSHKHKARPASASPGVSHDRQWSLDRSYVGSRGSLASARSHREMFSRRQDGGSRKVSEDMQFEAFNTRISKFYRPFKRMAP
eukprot:176411_1